jgi:ATP-dependent Lhr-like helicase
VPPRKSVAEPDLLPDHFLRWFAMRGWSPREHQLALLEKARDDRSALLIAPTGAGKTLAGFLPTLVELSNLAPLAGRGRLVRVSARARVRGRFNRLSLPCGDAPPEGFAFDLSPQAGRSEGELP